MYKLFTPSQATNLIGTVAPLLSELQDALRDLTRLRADFETLRPDSLRARQLATEMAFVLEGARVTKNDLDTLGVLLQDVEQGLIDFPSTLGAEVVYLCWAQGEDAITHYHALNKKVSERQLLPENTPRPGQGNGTVLSA